MASSSRVAAAAVPSVNERQKKTELDAATMSRLLQHANEVRKHASLDTLDAFLEQSGHTWIEVMISHARDSYESMWCVRVGLD